MFCENCGSAIKDGAKFCSQCGAPVKMRSTVSAAQPEEPKAEDTYREAETVQPAVPIAPAPYQENTAGNNRFNGTYYNGNNSESRPAGRLQSFVAEAASSGLFLVTTILFTAVLVINLLSSILTVSVGGNTIIGLIDEIAYQAGFSLDEIGGIGTVSSLVNGFSAGTIVATIISMIPSILIAVGLWLIFASAKSSQGTSVKPAGFTIIKVIYLIFFWIMIVVGAIGIILLILAAVLTADYSGAAAAVFIVLIAIIAAIVALSCLYCSKIAKMLTSAREVGIGASDRLMVSTYVQVLTWIAGICLAISAIASIGSAGLISSLISSVVPTEVYSGISAGVSAGFIVPFLSNICSAAATICFAVIIGKMKSREY
ncbi:MAG: zinc-ribbon domain-containing protein [Lachnospiraceae bacterium]|nr:zinc-ribbon domain-containing protein [Lachnospiraceae bacterium]